MIEKFNQMSDVEFSTFIKTNRLLKVDAKTEDYILYRLALIKGNKYLSTGDKSIFC